MIRMKHALLLALLGGVMAAGAQAAPSAIVAPLMTKPLDDYPGKEAEMISSSTRPARSIPSTATTRTRSCTSSRARS